MKGIVTENKIMDQGTKVEWNPLIGWSVNGKICGISSNGVPILGLSYIIELDEPLPGYPYSHAVAFEAHLKEIA